jgi:hypothetical protein
MKAIFALVLFSVVSVLPQAVAAGNTRSSETAAYAVKYEGGNVRLERRKATAKLGASEIVVTAGRQRIAVPVESITEIAFGSGVRKRFGAPVLDVVPFMKLGDAEAYYVGVSWMSGGAKSEAVFRLSNSDCHEFLAALERMTGKKAVDTNQTPTTVRYRL